MTRNALTRNHVMVHSALTRYRRTPSQEPILRLIAFQLRHNWFCLPLTVARRVIPCSAQNPALELGFTQLHNEPVPLVDIAERVYQPAPLLLGNLEPPRALSSLPTQTIVVVDSPKWGLLGLLVDSTPSLKRARQSNFSPVPAAYLMINHLQGINTLITLSETEPPLFFLEVDTFFP
ncbi:chemotaxis protein CheW [Nodosilinea sp. LEGE 07088]|uniref:chemotaxis protein CheW n=1 Tax=Nodosilinea sp. LEGE 07088 TaxID=2777968 RepID=UPI00188003DD|nr:chemotaxis protein CheW [Nodosilinea sp. LEGE 07088]MBE9139479.1 chemotaxis protein CheW [Nodosilinea sp. LEGE 07088]